MEKNIFKKGWDKITSIVSKETVNVSKKEPEAFRGTATHLMTYSYSGEKNLGEMGPAIDYRLDYELLRIRSWQSQLESDVCKTIIKRFGVWVIGKGLKLQCEPEANVLKQEGINIDRQTFSDTIESRFNLFKKSKTGDYSGMKSIDKKAFEAHKNAIIGGDVLVIQRFDGKNQTIQLVDGCHVQSPNYGNEYFPIALGNGNSIINGVEIDSKGKHIAYYVRIYDANRMFSKYDRISARDQKTGLLMAWMVYGSDHRLDNIRGLPLLAACLETAKKMERYKEAVLGSAEEIAKIVYQVVHQAYSDGSNPLADRLAQASGLESDKPEIARDVAGQAVASAVAASTNKQALNMPIGSELKSVTNNNPTIFKDFYEVNSDLLCATISIPPNVAFCKYNDSFSASRAAIKDWEHTLGIEREDFATQFYDPIYALWFYIQVLQNKIQAPGYLTAKLTDNTMVIEAYQKTRWVGSQVPHIDPVKEVTAERLKLGGTGALMPLTTLEAATEALNGGESESNMKQYAKELETSKSLGIEIEIEETSMTNSKDSKKKKEVDDEED